MMYFPSPTPEYADLKTWKEDWGIVYGPIQSRRLGVSLGINILGSGQKACSFDCPYCELGRTEIRMKDLKTANLFPDATEIQAAVAAAFEKYEGHPSEINFVSFVGNGEPTLHPDFENVVAIVKGLRDRWIPKAQLVVFTNGSTLDSRKVISGLNLFDERFLKVDAGNDAVYKAMNEPIVRMSLPKLIAGARKLTDVTLQCMFVHGIVNNTEQKDLDDWMEVVGMLKPKAVHLYSLDRVPPLSGLKKVEEETLDRIAAQLERRMKIRPLVFG